MNLAGIFLLKLGLMDDDLVRVMKSVLFEARMLP